MHTHWTTTATGPKRALQLFKKVMVNSVSLEAESNFVLKVKKKHKRGQNTAAPRTYVM
jgi:hypothetical protein